jgi:hypothetical protein
MMRLLHWALAPSSALSDSLFPEEWGIPPSRLPSVSEIAFSVLYSDIGEEFYRRCGPIPDTPGWQVVSPNDTSFDLKVLDANLHDVALASHELEWLYEEEAVHAWEADSRHMTEDLSMQTSSTYRICILPRGGVAGYLNRRVTEVAPENLTNQRMTWGARNIRSDGTLHFATWAPDPMAPTSKTITISRLRADVKSFSILLKALCQYAQNRVPQYERLEIWNLPKELQDVASSFGGVTSIRTEHLNALCVYGIDFNNVQWVYNERFYNNPHFVKLANCFRQVLLVLRSSGWYWFLYCPHAH